MLEKLDKTIENICDWVDSNLCHVSTADNSQVMADMVKALAELVTARANLG
ncbi:hypothetical protein Ana3638_11745 [Anaerocolumna sedimenticola]|uniref:Uncharacterized protein n=1 Tax=Anaerocolumna sedimenticola TaxID=2696063 RepID=A0A6P1TMI6_9FIRM|nr:hypothetical protein [Anaerocolumna sedimenticola]QHQ61362.1 hypothetical protein Ana3638_11745 [Anaerocolumna sedimenticola]